jgi:hypothetical protein
MKDRSATSLEAIRDRASILAGSVDYDRARLHRRLMWNAIADRAGELAYELRDEAARDAAWDALTER